MRVEGYRGVKKGQKGRHIDKPITVHRKLTGSGS